LAASLIAGDTDGMRRCQQGLKSVASSFCAFEIANILQQDVDEHAISRLRQACDEWLSYSNPS
jgi:hypothetical protein